MDWICFSCGKIFDSYKEKSEHRKNCKINLKSLETYKDLSEE